ncbi:Dps family protein [Marinitenerispora sediminis]|uniref:DNA starvation/stationary phase protection protein n=1 Tax=Marinitenerispora sediminis TaxID=1931232 RepID=A0A368T6S4_9ACTN|nr:DNA starvation/stationary phase protection protein [Marinitenerispora sediminis]RCV48838.1 DNA starvation/stationary phase protection protein [Marinitenerispora sediminis]RCV55732.1 DNA starvation/stationary phase protection protein [Marinitenerispora sediminis]RCV59215.1 DNA starvation/stationary phase protection protein [Marinitenerispora sediminis]
MAKIHSPLSEDARRVTGEALQGAVIDLIDLSLVAKQAHWNVIGRNFRSVHLQLDELVAAARTHTDTLAERAVAIGVNPDGRSSKVAADTRIAQPEAGYLHDDKVVATITDVLGGVVHRFRQRVADTERSDPLSQDLLIAAGEDLEQQHWMFEAMSGR